MEQAEDNINVLPPDKDKIRRLWTVAGYLAAVTAVEFIIAFTMNHGPLKVSNIVGLTLVQASSIVCDFMHFSYEVMVMLWSFPTPLTLELWMILAFIYGGMAI